jgi:hypothetical protein
LNLSDIAATAVIAMSALTGVTGVPAFSDTEATGESAFIGATGLSATGVPAYTGATAGAGLPCIATAAAGENRLRANVTEARMNRS